MRRIPREFGTFYWQYRSHHRFNLDEIGFEHDFLDLPMFSKLDMKTIIDATKGSVALTKYSYFPRRTYLALQINQSASSYIAKLQRTLINAEVALICASVLGNAKFARYTG